VIDNEHKETIIMGDLNVDYLVQNNQPRDKRHLQKNGFSEQLVSLKQQLP